MHSLVHVDEMSFSLFPLTFILPHVLALGQLKCPLLFDGRVHKDVTPADFDKNTSIYDHQFVHGQSTVYFLSLLNNMTSYHATRSNMGRNYKISFRHTKIVGEYIYTSSETDRSLTTHTKFELTTDTKAVEVTIK